MAIHTSVTCSGTATTEVSSVVVLNWRQPSFNASVQVLPSDANVGFKVQTTNYPVLASGTTGAVWSDADSSTGLDAVTGSTAGELGALVAPITAIRLACATSTANASGTMTIIQGDD